MKEKALSLISELEQQLQITSLSDYRFYGYKFAQSDTHYPEDTFQWYDREREVLVEGSLILYRNEQLTLK